MKNDEKDYDDCEPQVVELDGEKFEVIDAICYDDENYIALVPYTDEYEFDEDEDLEFVILREIEENGEYMLATVDDEDLYDELGEAFIEHLSETFGDECEDDECEFEQKA